MATVTVDLPDSAFSSIRRPPDEFAKEMRLAAAIHWYSRGDISQGSAAEIAGLGRRDFLAALSRAGVDAIQITADDLKGEVERDLQARRERLAADLPDASGAA